MDIEYYNVDKGFILTEAEGVGMLCVHMLAIMKKSKGIR